MEPIRSRWRYKGCESILLSTTGLGDLILRIFIEQNYLLLHGLDRRPLLEDVV